MKKKSMSTIRYQGKYLSLCENERGWEYCERVNQTGAVMIFACTEEGQVILVEEYRPPIQKNCICFPAGLSGDEGEESDLLAAQRELEEETGYQAQDWKHLFCGPSSPGLSSESLQFYLARGLSRTSRGGGVEGENIKVHLIPRSEIDTWLQQQMDAGIAIDPRVYTGLYFLNKELI